MNGPSYRVRERALSKRLYVGRKSKFASQGSHKINRDLVGGLLHTGMDLLQLHRPLSKWTPRSPIRDQDLYL